MPTRKQKPHPSGQVVSVRLGPELIQRLDDLSERTDRSRGSYLRLALEMVLPIMEERHWQQRLSKQRDDATEQEFRRITNEFLDEEENPDM